MHIERSSVAEYNRFSATLQEAVKGYRDVPHFENSGEAARHEHALKASRSVRFPLAWLFD
jgi:hypothetical protein